MIKIYSLAFLAGIVFALIAWTGESIIHSYYFHEGTFLSQLIPHDINERWMRCIISFLFMFMAFIAAYFIHKIKRINQKLMLAHSALNHMYEGCVITDKHNRIIYINLNYTDLTGYSAHEVLGKNPSILSSGKQNKTFYRNMWLQLNKHGCWEGEIWNRKKSGELFPEWIKLNVIRNTQGKPRYYVGVFSDITSRKKEEAKLLHYAFYDPLTGLPNRRLFTERLEQAFRAAKRDKEKIAVIFLDLDYFKDINDQHGHMLGDKLLCQISDTIKSTLRDVDTLSRFGGDEFVILLPNLSSKKDVTQLTKRLLSSFKNFRFVTKSHKLPITASMGGALYPHDSMQTAELIRHADAAMYHVKQNGRNNFCFYKKGMRSISH